jgi:beta-glucanase (GH16 family)
MTLLTKIACVAAVGVLAACAGTSGSHLGASAPSSTTTPPAPAVVAARTTVASTSLATGSPIRTTVAVPAAATTAVATTAVRPTTTTAVVGGGGVPVPSSSNTSTVGNCGGVVIAKPGGGDWQCTFDDEFTGTTLNNQNWVVQQTATSGYTTGSGSGTACYLDSPNNVSVAGGYLNLTVRKEAKPFTCTDPFGNFVTQYSAGMVSTYKLFSQQYGLFEVSAKLPAATVQGLQETLWLWPSNDTKYGAWPASGEIDFAEFYSEYPTLDIPYIHYDAARTDPNVTSYNCTIANEGQFNTYGVQWSSSSITILYDGKTCLVDTWGPAAPLVAPEPFNEPFIVALTQALGINTNVFEPGTTPLPATTQVDWVRAWK